jgi:hypothetical protein
MGIGTRRGLLAALFMVALESPPTVAESSESSNVASVSGGLLTRSFVVGLPIVSQFFPEITKIGSTGWNKTAVGNPSASRAVFYTNGGESKLVTITVDRYSSVGEAADAYKKAVHLSVTAPGFKAISIPLHVSQESFAGISTDGGETHLGLGALNGNLILGATLAGFDPTLDDLVKLVGLARAVDAAANAAAGR